MADPGIQKPKADSLEAVRPSTLGGQSDTCSGTTASTGQTESSPASSALPQAPQEPSSSHDPAPTPPPTCTTCATLLNPDSSKPCPRCHTTPYCSRECQKKDFKPHKKICAQLAQEYANKTVFKMATTRVVPKEGRKGGLQKWQFDT